MRQVKCRICSTLHDIDKAYKYVNIKSSGKVENRYYCSEEEFLKFQSEKEYRVKFETKFNDIMKYTVINSYTKKLYNDIQKSGYTSEEIYNCLLIKERDIVRALAYKRNIEDEKLRIKYVFAIIRNAMFDITLKKRREEKVNEINKKKDKDIEVVEYKNNKRQKQERKGILDLIGDR